MRDYIISPIPDIIREYRQLINGETKTIFVSNTGYSLVPALQIYCDDVYKGKKGFIKKDQIKNLHNVLQILRRQRTIIVGCDAGLSRSPAVASAIAYLLGDYSVRDDIHDKYKFYNKDIYTEIISYGQRK